MDLNFLTIADLPEDLHPLRDLLRPFEHDTAVQISLQRVGWERAWQILLIDALRIFSAEEVTSIGGASQFHGCALMAVTLSAPMGITRYLQNLKPAAD